jgi:uncharacterized protein (UPF0332 family)
MSKSELIKYRVSRSKETLEEAKLLSNNNHWNSVANRLYYACFYIVNALFLKNDITFTTHNGVKREFHKSFIKTGIISIENGKLYSRLFNLRQEGDYIDFKRFDKTEIEPFIDKTKQFIEEIEKIIIK